MVNWTYKFTSSFHVPEFFSNGNKVFGVGGNRNFLGHRNKRGQNNKSEW
jgi:hypothetical protein